MQLYCVCIYLKCQFQLDISLSIIFNKLFKIFFSLNFVNSCKILPTYLHLKYALLFEKITFPRQYHMCCLHEYERYLIHFPNYYYLYSRTCTFLDIHITCKKFPLILYLLTFHACR